MDNTAKIIRDRLYAVLDTNKAALKYDAAIPVNVTREFPEDGYSIKEMPLIAIDLPQMEDYELFDSDSVRQTFTVPIGIYDCTEVIWEKKVADEERLFGLYSNMLQVFQTYGYNLRDYLVFPHFVSHSYNQMERLSGGITALFCELALPVIQNN